MSDFGRLKSIGVSMAVAVCMLALVGCPPSGVPVITGADRDEVPATIPTELEIAGTGFAQGAVVIFGTDELGTIATVPASSVAANGTSLTVLTPVIDIDEDTPINYCVQNPSGRVSEHVDILFGAPPSLAGVFPTQVPAQVPTQIAISGSNLDPGAEVCFLANTGQFGCDTLSAGQTVETAALTGTVGPTLVSVKITNDDGQMDVLTGAILYEAAPTVLQVIPAEVPATIPTEITIFGRGFDNGATVRFVDSDGEVLGTEFFKLDCQGQCADTQILTGKSPVVEGLTDDECIYAQVVFANGTSTEPGAGQPVVKALGEFCLIAPPVVANIVPGDVPSATTETEVTLSGPNLRPGSSVIARIPEHSHLAFGNGLNCGSDIPEIPEFPVKNGYGYGSDCGTSVEISDVEFQELVAGGALTFVRPVIEDNPSTPQFEGVRESILVEFAVVDEWGQESEDAVLVQYNTSPRILGVSPEQIPATVPITFVATLNNISLDGNGRGDLEFFWYNSSTGDLGPSIGKPSADMWEDLVDPNAPAQPGGPDALAPTIAVRAVTPQYFGAFNTEQYNIAAVVTNADGQRAIKPLTLSGEAEILRVYNEDTGFAEVPATYVYEPPLGYNKGASCDFLRNRNVVIEGIDLDTFEHYTGPIEVRFSRHGSRQNPNPDLDQDGTLLDIVQGTFAVSALGVSQIVVEAPAFPCGELAEDELIQIRIRKEDGQVTRESAVGVINYKAQPRLTSIVTIPNPEAVHGDDQFPATIPTIFEIEAENLASSLYLALPREQVAFYIPADDEEDQLQYIDRHWATVPFTTGSSDPHQTPLVGVELLDSPAIGETDVARGRTPAIFGLTEHTLVTVVAYDKYGQASVEALEDCGAFSGNPVRVEALAPPQIASFLTTVENCAGEEITLPSVAPGTGQVDATFEIVGSLFTPGIVAKFYRDSEFDDDKGIWVGVGEPFAEIPASELGGDFAESLTGAIPALLGPDEETELNVSIVLCAQDLQMSEAFPGIKYLGLPTVQKVRVRGTETEDTPDSGDSFFVTNGPFRNAINVDSGDDPLWQGPAVTFEVVGLNLDCRSPVTGEGSVDITLTAGADAIEETFYNADSSSSILADQDVYGGSATEDRSLGRIEFGIPDRAQTYNLNGTPDMRSMTDGFGVLDMTLCDCMGQTATYDNVLATIQGPTAPGEGNAIAFAVGDVNGDGLDDVATLVAAVSAYYSYTPWLNVWFGTTGDTIDIVPNFTYDIGNDPANPYGNTVSAFDATLSARRMIIGDFKNDGRGDIVIGMPDRNFEGAPYGDNGNAPASSFGSGSDGYVVYFEGVATGVGISDARYIPGPQLGDAGFGTSIASGYINNDAFEDLVVSAPGFSEGALALSTGRAYVFFGGPNFAQGITPPGEDFFITPNNANPNDFFALGLAVGDYNNDGFEDIFAGSPGFDTESGVSGAIVNTGRTYQYNGGNSIDAIPDFEFAFGAAEERFEGGYPVVADFNGDGIVDLLIGRPGPGNEGDHTGDAVFFQGADGTPIDENGILVPSNEEGLPLFSWLAGKGGTIAGYDDGGILFGVPDFNQFVLPAKQIDFAEGLYEDAFRNYLGVVQNFPADSSIPSPLNVGVDTSDSLINGVPLNGFDIVGNYLNLSTVIIDDSAYEDDVDVLGGSLYGILIETGNVLAGEGDDFFIALPGLGAVTNAPFSPVQTGGGLVIVPNGLNFSPAIPEAPEEEGNDQ